MDAISEFIDLDVRREIIEGVLGPTMVEGAAEAEAQLRANLEKFGVLPSPRPVVPEVLRNYMYLIVPGSPDVVEDAAAGTLRILASDITYEVYPNATIDVLSVNLAEISSNALLVYAGFLQEYLKFLNDAMNLLTTDKAYRKAQMDRIRAHLELAYTDGTQATKTQRSKLDPIVVDLDNSIRNADAIYTACQSAAKSLEARVLLVRDAVRRAEQDDRMSGYNNHGEGMRVHDSRQPFGKAPPFRPGGNVKPFLKR